MSSLAELGEISKSMASEEVSKRGGFLRRAANAARAKAEPELRRYGDIVGDEAGVSAAKRIDVAAKEMQRKVAIGAAGGMTAGIVGGTAGAEALKRNFPAKRNGKKERDGRGALTRSRR